MQKKKTGKLFNFCLYAVTTIANKSEKEKKLLRIIIISNKADSVFGSLLVIGLGIPIVFQALVNIGVSVELFPITGQPLPLISSGGTSIWMTCIAIGIIQSVRNGSELKTDNENEDSPLDILKETI